MQMGDMRTSVRWILGSQYFLYFGVMGVFLPFFNLYCHHLGFSGFQIGVLSAIRTVIGVIFPLLWAMMADRLKIRKSLYVVCHLISASLFGLFLFSADFTAMVMIMTVYSIFYSPLISFLETLTMKLLGEDRNSYGKIRVWGSVSFILCVLVIGKMIDQSSVSIIILLIFSASLLQALLSPMVPDSFPQKPSVARPGKGFFSARMILFLTCAFLMLLSHGTYYGFFSIHLEAQGFDTVFTGISWALASCSEIIVMLNSRTIFKRFSFDRLILFSLLVAAMRWLLLYFAVSPVLILASQMLHSITYGVFHISSILYIDRLSHEESKTVGQSVNNAVTYGFGMMAGFLVNGYLYEKLGASLFLFSSGCAFAGALLFYFGRDKERIE
jgi:PPP family 3-phenylpropionic acid transporter